MTIKIFVLGRPGCGKSSAARHILKLARRQNLEAQRVNDYDILQAMLRADQGFTQIRPTERCGFEVLDFSILDTALNIAEQQTRRLMRSSDIVIIEFARKDYGQALRQFSRTFLKDAFFVFIDTDTNICIQRIHNRVINATTSDDHFVSTNILKHYYCKQYLNKQYLNKQDLSLHLKSEYGIDEEKVFIINNQGSRHTLDMQINRLFNFILKQEKTIISKKVLGHFADIIWQHTVFFFKKDRILVPANTTANSK
jgi:GTPase SAR1 family protein